MYRIEKLTFTAYYPCCRLIDFKQFWRTNIYFTNASDKSPYLQGLINFGFDSWNHRC